MLTDFGNVTNVFGVIRESVRGKMYPDFTMADIRKYFRLKKQIKNISGDIHFLKLCLQKKVFPKFVDKHIKNKAQSDITKIKLKQKAIQLEISNHYSKRTRLELEAYNLHLFLTKRMNGNWWNAVEKCLYDDINRSFFIKKATLKKKFMCLNPNKKLVIKTREENFKNLSGYELSSEEKALLNQGIKSCFSYCQNIEDYILDIDNASNRLQYNLKNSFKNECLPIIQKVNKHQSKRSKQHCKLVKKLEQKNLVITKADKGNTVVILDKDNYIRRTENMLNDEAFKLLKKDPLNKYKKQVNDCLKACNNIIADSEKKHLKINNPKIPKLYTLPKIHKPGDKMRPIVSSVNSPAYKLAKWMNKRLNLFESFDSLSIKNSFDFVEKVKDIRLDKNDILVSFDVESLYPSIPLEKTKTLCRKWFEKNNISEKNIEEYMQIITVCTEQRFFQFNNKFYIQKDGLTMGNPLSSILSELFMSDLEMNVKESSSLFKHWSRKVDDIFAVIDRDKVDECLQLLNSIEDTVNFTVEIEKEGTLPFLDLKVIRVNNRLEFDIYRKPTHVDVYINEKAYNPREHKLAAFRSLIQRMIKVPLTPERLNRERTRIIEIGQKNGFEASEINRIINTAKYKQRIRNITTLQKDCEERKWVSVNYHPAIYSDLKKVFKNYGLCVAPKNKYNLRNIGMRNLKDETPVLKKSGIYKINCSGCEKVYIGQTKRDIETRAKEHARNIKNEETTKSAVAKHFWEAKHSIELKPELLKSVTKVSQLNTAEKLYIFKHRANVLNEDLDGLDNILFRALESKVQPHACNATTNSESVNNH